MDKDRRDNLREIIGRARRRVEESLGSRLVSYGLFVDRELLTRAELTSLRPEQEEHYQRVLDAVRRHARAVGQGDEEVSAPAVARFVRETGGTWVNRLAGLRALETRGLLDPPAAFVSEEYGGLSPRAVRLRQQAAERGRPMAPEEALRAGIEHACGELSESVRVLFDLSDEHSLVWLDGPTLRDLLRLFSTEVTQADWAQPDILGWVYQYYNTEANAALKRLKNRTASFKYRPDDIPIANQFYTPHWVVRVLADNTLGRLWLEMQNRLPRLEHQDGATDGGGTAGGYSLVERRRDVSHARDAAEAFRAWILEEPDPQQDGTVDRLCRFLVPLPSIAPPRVAKPVREIRVLDPACGSGHFLLYAFDLFFAMYREAEPDLDIRMIPALILEHNLFGIDIDLRAAQLTAFSLYLKARTTLAAIDAKAQLDLRRLNIVVADAHINDDPRKTAFLDRFRHDPEIQELYRKVLADLDHTNALGSLIKVRTEFETLFGRIQQSREKARKAAEAFDPAQPVLVETSSQLGLRETYRGYSGRTWTIRELLDELRLFEAEVTPSQDIGARLFYTDLERTVGLLSLMSEQYDVVLMNPPYGDMPTSTKDYLKGNRAKRISAHYPRTHHDLATAFLEQGLDVLVEQGFVGALVPRSFMYLSIFEKLRTQVLLEEAQPELLQEYGLGILDGATVRTVGAVVRKAGRAGDATQHMTAFHRLAYYPTNSKIERFLASLPTFGSTGPDVGSDWFVARLGSLRDIPGMPYAYWASDTLRGLFTKYPPLDRDQAGVMLPGRPDMNIAEAKVGLQTSDDARFVRYWWEVDRGRTGRDQRWVPFVKGGPHVRYYSRIDLVVNWDRDGEEIRNFPRAVIRNPGFYFRPGVTWPPASWRIRRFGTFGQNHIFGHKGCSIFPTAGSAAAIAGLLNSSLGTAAMLMQTPERMWEVGMVGAVPIALAGLTAPRIAELAGVLVEHRRVQHAGDEACRDFRCPDLLDLFAGNDHGAGAAPALPVLLEAWRERRRQSIEEEDRLVQVLDEEVYGVYGIAEEDRRLIESELARRPRAEGGYAPGERSEQLLAEELLASDHEASKEEDDDEGEEKADSDEDREAPAAAPDVLAPGLARGLVARWLSYYLKQTIEADEDGIVPVDAILGEPALIIRLREAMERDLDSEAARALEQQAPEYLGTEDLAQWIATSREESVQDGAGRERLPVGFFPWHVALYRNRPIFWLLSSENFDQGNTRITFRVYLDYLKLTPDTLSRVVTHYLDTTIATADREWQLARDQTARAEGRARAGAQRAASEWANTVDALQRFRAAVEAVIQGPEHAQQVAATAKWLPRTIAQVRGGRDVGHGYQPDIDFGVRVNITPLVEKRLLPRVVLTRLGG